MLSDVKMRLDKETDPDILRQAALLLEKANQKLTQKVIDLTRELVKLKGAVPSKLRSISQRW